MAETKSKLEDILKGEKANDGKTQTEQPDLRTTLEKELDADDVALAKDLQRSRAEMIIAQRRDTIERLRYGKGGQSVAGEKAAGERGKEWLTDVAKGLLDRGLDPTIVGRTIDYLIGASQAPLIGLPGAPAPSQGMSFADIKEIFKMGQESNKSDPAIAAILSKLADKVEELKATRREPESKKSFIVVRPDGSFHEVDADKPIVIQPPEHSIEGKPLEVVKEENRHSERMQEIDAEKKYKEQMAATIGELPERIGAGFANHILSGEGEGKPVTKTATTEVFNCTHKDDKGKTCGTAIPVPPGVSKIECPACHAIYEK